LILNCCFFLILFPSFTFSFSEFGVDTDGGVDGDGTATGCPEGAGAAPMAAGAATGTGVAGDAGGVACDVPGTCDCARAGSAAGTVADRMGAAGLGAWLSNDAPKAASFGRVRACVLASVEIALGIV